ncbi:MAG: DNA internalization-related competence protein ComEC/Rec2, partial [Anaerovoracaceae bacterium]
ADEKKKEKCEFVIKTEEGSRVLVNVYDAEFNYQDLPGREVTIKGSLSLPTQKRNPGCFDYREYLKSKRIRTILIGESVKIGEVKNKLAEKSAKVRFDFQNKLFNTMKEKEANVVIGMLFGDKTDLDEELYERFQRNGTAHILSVSGLHIGIIYGFLCGLMGGKRRVSVNIVILLFLIFYAAIADFCPSVVRAVMMIFLHVLSKLFHYRYDLMSAGAVTAVLMLLVNPYGFLGVGFQLSFLAIFTMAALLPFLKNQKSWLKNLLGTLRIQVGMAPFTAYAFNYFSLGTFLANIPVIFLSGLIIPLGLIAVGVSLLLPGLLPILGIIMEKSVWILLLSNDLFYGNSKTSWDVLSPPLAILLLYYGGLFFFSSELFRVARRRRNFKVMGAGVLVILFLSVGLTFAIKDDFGRPEIVFVDVGQGACLLVKSPSGKVIMIDGGGKQDYDVGKKTVKPYLLKNGVRRIDLAIVSHLDLDHYGGIASLCQEGMVKTLGLQEDNKEKAAQLEQETGMKNKDFLYLKRGDVIAREKGFSLEILGPVEKTEDENERCLVVKLSYGELDIFTGGDIGIETEKKLVNYYAGTNRLQAEILVAPHHGSKGSSSQELIQAVNPKIAMIQVGKNNYGHPAQQILERYEEKKVKIHRNDES